MGDSSSADRAWAVAACAIFAIIVMMGGTSAPSATARLVISLVSLLTIVMAAWRLRGKLHTNFAKSGFIIIACMLALFAAQQIPLPGAWSASLPGRAPFAAAATAAGINPFSSALSLDPSQTRETMLATLPGIAMFALALASSTRSRLLFAGVIAILAIVSAILGMVQHFTASETWYFYDPGTLGVATGIFGNRNFLAALLYASIPMLGALTLATVKEQRIPGWIAATLGIAYLVIILGGLAVAASRSGIILSMAAIIATALLPWGSLTSIRTRATKRVALYGVLAFLFVFSQFGLVGLLRLAATDALTEYRTVISHVSWLATTAMFPAGSGFGTFVPVYQMFETAADLRPEFVNHAHNDWLEIVLEGGLPALLLLTAFLGWFGAACVRIWMRRSEAPVDLVMTASSISVTLLLLHSAVDYPLRTPTLMAVLGLCCGFMASNFLVRQRSHVNWQQAQPNFVPNPVARKPFKPFGVVQSDTDKTPGAKT